MLEKILEVERGLFFRINSLHTPFMDGVMWLYSEVYTWMPFLLFFCLMLIYKKSWREWLPILVSIIVIGSLCMAFSSYLTKPLFARPRPVFHPSFMDDVRTIYDSVAEPYGFVSGHSATAFGLATFTALLFRNTFYTCAIFLWAFLMAYSRIYLGVHFISDIVAGALAGIAFGFLVFRLYRSYTKQNLPTPEETPTPTDPPLYGKIIGLILIGYIFFFAATSSIWVKFFF